MVRQHLAYEAARIMAEQGIHDFGLARRKAAERVGVLDRRQWPKNSEVQSALLQQHRLFRSREQVLELKRLREEALAAMQVFVRFRPRLVGPVLDGTADSHSGLRLHLFADTPEDIVLELLGMRIRWQQRECSLLYASGQRKLRPTLLFRAGDVAVELVALPLVDLRNPPLNPVTERPDKGASVEQVRALLDAPPDMESS